MKNKKILSKTMQVFFIASSFTANSANFPENADKVDTFINESQLDNFIDNQTNNWSIRPEKGGGDIYDAFKNESQLDNSLDNNRTNVWSTPPEIEIEITNRARNIAQQGLNSLKKGDRLEAIKKLNEAWEIDPKLDLVGVLITLTYIDEKNYLEAYNTAQKLQHNSPKNAQGLILEGITHSLEGDHVKSQASYKKAIEIEPGSPSANQNLATYAIINHDYDKARKLYQTVLSYHPEHIKTLIKLAELENLAGNTEEAFKLINQAIAKKPDALDPRIEAAHLYLAKGQAKSAIKVIEPIISKNETSAVLLETLGRANLLNAQPQEAAKNFLKWSKLYPEEKWAHLRLAEALEQLKLIDQALEEVNAALKLDNNDFLSKFAKAKLLALKGDLPAAKKIVLEIKSANEKNYEKLFGRTTRSNSLSREPAGKCSRTL